MPELTALLAPADLFLRGGVGLVLGLLGGLLLRDYGRSLAARLGAGLALGAAAYAICSWSGFHDHHRWWAAPILVLAAGNNVVLWLFAQALFDDDFQLKPWHGGLWLVVAALALANAYGVAPASAAGQGARTLLTLIALSCALLAAGQALATWRGDLVERRRALRVFVVATCAGFTGLNATVNLLGLDQVAPQTASLIAGSGLAIVALSIAWALLRVSSDGSLFKVAATLAAAPAKPSPETAPLSAEDRRLLGVLQGLMAVERAYRQEGLTIGALAARMNLPEHRLRRLINQGLGHRNFASFLNQHRIAETRDALADPAQSAVPVLTIALDAGFSSLGPFNRAFKADTGLTPTDFRRARLGAPGRQPSVQASTGR